MQSGTPQPPRTCVAGALALGPAPGTLALLHSALLHSGPAIPRLEVLVAGLIKAFLWGPHSESPAPSTPLAPAEPLRALAGFRSAHLCHSLCL